MKLVYFTLFVCFVGYSQNQTQLEVIQSKTNRTELLKLKNLFDSLYIEREKRIDIYLSQNPLVERRITDGFYTKEIYDVTPTGEILYNETDNANSAVTARANALYDGGSLGLNVQGQGMNVGVWDGGQVRDDHVEFTPFKVVNMNPTVENNNHATHVMGTIIANGTNPAVRGLAFNATGESYDWNNDSSEMSFAASAGLLVSNHSYGPSTSGANNWFFGAYDTSAAQMDLLAFNAPYYLIVKSAGNDRNATNDPVIGPYLLLKGGYNLIKTWGNSKNIMTVGAVNQVLSYVDATSVVMSSFSSWGPSDDGRIKPDIVAKGVNVVSTTIGSTTSTGAQSGTSMSSPAVSGVALLLQQHYNNLYTSYMKAATLKGLILHTADEAGYYPGPDYEYGWGLINAQKAATTISGKSSNSSIIDELNLVSGQSYTRTVAVTNGQPLMVSISWTDRAGTANNAQVDPTNLNLVNDLDLRITKNSVMYYPWTLEPTMTYAEASQNTDNFRDNFEKVHVNNPDGLYTITVTHKGTLVGGSQDFSMIVTGSNVTLNTESFEIPTGFSIYPNPTNGMFTLQTFDLDLDSTVRVYDTNGRLILSKVIQSDMTPIDLSNVSEGIYYVNYSDSTKTETKKIVVKR